MSRRNLLDGLEDSVSTFSGIQQELSAHICELAAEMIALEE